MGKKINIDTFVAEEITRLRGFAARWKNNMKNDPRNFPAKLEPGEWDEQLRADQE